MITPQTLFNERSESLLWQRRGAVAFWAAAGVFLAAAIGLAAVNRNAGSNDSRNNLETARNLVEGRGFQSNIVQQLFEKQPLPNPETVRPPGIPFLMAGLFWIFGISLKIQVVANAATVLATAWLLRWTIRRAGGRWFAEAAGVLVLLSGNYEIHSIWSNNILVLSTVALLAVAATMISPLPPGEGQGVRGRRNGRSIFTSPHPGPLPEGEGDSIRWPWLAPATLCGLITAVGFLTKPTFVITAVPLGAFLFLVAPAAHVPIRKRLLACSWFVLVLVALTSPYWVHNLVLFGRPVYSPSTACRLSLHYDDAPYGYGHTLRWDKPESVRELVGRYGYGGLARRELSMWVKTGVGLAYLNLPVVLLAAASLLLVRRRPERWKQYAVPVLAMAEPIFVSAIYHHVEFRYLWPVYPACLYLVGLAVRDYPMWPQHKTTATPQILFRLAMAAVLVAAVYHTSIPWRRAFAIATQPPPSWVVLVKATPADAIVMTDDPYSVAWYGERRAVRCPGGPRADLVRVIDEYHPAYFLHTGSQKNRQTHGPLAFAMGDLVPLAAGPAPEPGETWEFALLRRPKTEDPSDSAAQAGQRLTQEDRHEARR